MKRIFLFLGVGIPLLFTVVACGGGNAQVQVVNEKNNGNTITMRAGGVLEVKLESNPTTGYDWSVAQVDTKVIKQEGEAEFKQDKELIGAGGITTIRMVAVSKGQTTLKLDYHRPWEKDIPPEKTYQVTIVVK